MARYVFLRRVRPLKSVWENPLLVIVSVATRLVEGVGNKPGVALCDGLCMHVS